MLVLALFDIYIVSRFRIHTQLGDQKVTTKPVKLHH